MHIKRVLRHTKCAVLVCCEPAITFVPEIIWRVTYPHCILIISSHKIKLWEESVTDEAIAHFEKE